LGGRIIFYMNTTSKEYLVSLEGFEGPLDLLHQLIEKRKLQINTISLAKITADYMAHIRAMAVTPAEEVARFVHIASILILIKSKSLLPILEYTNEEEVDVVELEDRMKLFDYIRERVVPVLAVWQRRSFAISAPSVAERIAFRPDNSCTMKGLRRNVGVVLDGLSFLREPPQKKVGTKVRIEEVIERVLATVTERVSVSFQTMSAHADKQETIVSFLAVLELMRKNLLTATQGSHFDDIVMRKASQ